MLESKSKRYRYPLELISIAVWSYHRFNDSYRDVSERLLYRGIDVSYETIRQWCIKFGSAVRVDKVRYLPQTRYPYKLYFSGLFVLQL